MPRIPKIESTRELTAQPPSTLREAASYAGKTVRGRTLQQTGEFLSRVGQYFEKIMDTHQYTQAQTESAKRLNDLYNKIQTDPETDIWTAGKTAQEEMAKIKNEASSKILNQLVREKFSADFELDSMRTTNAINDHLRKRQADELDASAREFMDTNTQASFSAPSDAEQQMIKANMKAKVDELVNLGVWEKKKAYEYWQEIEAKLRTGQVSHDADIDPEGTLIELRKGKNGIYPDLLEEERRKSIEEVETKIEKARKIAEENLVTARNQRESELLDMYWQGTITEKMVEDDRLAGRIDANFAVGMIKALRSPERYKPTALESIIKFNELVERNVALAKKEWFIKRAPFEDITKFRADVIDAKARGYITDAQMRELLSETSKTFYRNPVFQNALNQLAAQSKLYATSEAQARVKAEMYGNLITKVIAGKEPREAVVEVIREKLNTELNEAIKAGEVKDKRVIGVIEDLRKKNTPDSEIAKFMREKGLDPELYGVKE